MKYSGSDFKFTSQANHLAKLLTLKAENHRENIHAQRLYKRRKLVASDGHIMSNWHILNQSALPEQTTAAASASSVYAVVIGEGDAEDEGQVSMWEPIE